MSRQQAFAAFYRPPVEPLPDFQGATYDREHDHARLQGQIKRVHDVMSDGKWRTLKEIAAATGDGEASISAQLRNMRHKEFGAYIVERRSRAERSHGLYEYRIVI